MGRSTKTSNSSEEVTLATLNDKLDLNHSILEKKMDKILSDVEKLTLRVTKLELENTEHGKALNYISDEVDELRNRVKHLEAACDIFRLDDLKSSLEKMEQEKSRKGIILSGIPETPHENLLEILIRLANQLKISIKGDNVEKIFRTKSGNVLVSLNSTSIRNQLYDARKLIRQQQITSKTIGFTTDNTIYINELLSKSEQELFFRARTLKRQLGYKYAWTNNHVIYLKKDSKADAVVIRNKTDLDNLQHT